jgi:hypothetical protein
VCQNFWSATVGGLSVQTPGSGPKEARGKACKKVCAQKSDCCTAKLLKLVMMLLAATSTANGGMYGREVDLG